MPCTLTVRSGLHAGAHSSLTDGRTLIGRSLACDIVISDAHIADEHVALYLSGDKATVTALEKDVHLVGQGIVPAGHVAEISYPSDLQLEDITLHFDARRTRSKLFFAITGFVGVAVVGLSITANAFHSSDTLNPVVISDPIVPEITRSVSPDAIQAAYEALRARLENSELAQHIRLTRKDGALSVAAQLNAQQMASWKETERWFDASFGANTALIRDIHLSRNKPAVAKAPSIESVWFANKPFIRVDGARYHEGARLPNGWTLLQIGHHDARFQAPDQTVDVRY
ncbi:SctD/MshK family protein [Parasulfitobacter algicola]|uniref:FHA domain-containing protein n=1 Tax=Parasulfitobacter algicola TaxID=2614809 RepID=A0ABX2IZE9_9RHOB|nr:FHA domain-containing protein [Sulfitobacter algicola]NSX56770.1 hypothetical protein [Sulfitobacter algicola]